ncbi:DUF6449 domain-containing protein [Anaerocolumna sp. MB42-C2]|uniref:DUF6449 domain-containing protein n=1 Tax=Anaerocolumna sp. MB42-C2 TaxID=3070997 RepID=UPI0027DFBDCE|nr:DUF6449 domain-containing protein [Anaerocolumna sp. MB42-C2]WMJ88234.1 DUF6449 domain-containing protein [Anaerocolumna sp. MB42-C2]
MTSRNLFSKFLKEDLKRRIWAIALAFLVLFLFLPVACAIMIGNYRDVISRTYIINSLTNLLESQSVLLIMITIAGAVICGLSSFFYLHSKKKVDLYHSIPIKRETMFAACYLNGILIYIVPYIFNLLLCFIVLQINGFMSSSILAIALSALVVNLLYYCLIYTLLVIAAMLTGNFIINCFGAAVFILYGPMVKLIKEMYFSDFFKTYYARNDFESKYLFLSPLGSYVEAVQKINKVLNKDVFFNITSAVIVIVLMIGFALFLYKERPSEAAGKAMAFSISKPIIKFLLVIPITMGGGIIFREISYNRADGWWLFGMIFSFLLSYALIEIIYNFDIRCAFHNKKHILFSAIAVVLIAGFFRFDVLRYDSYIPDKAKIESMSVAITGVDDDMDYYSADIRNYSNVSYQLKNMKLTDFDVTYQLVKQGLEKPLKETEKRQSYTYYVKYNLKSKRTVYRTYVLKGNYDSLKNIFARKEYKEGHYPINQWKVQDIQTISCDNVLEYKKFNFSNEDKQQLLDIYKEELFTLSLDDLRDTIPLARIIFEFKDDRAQYNVYPSCIKTIDFLKKHGFNADAVMDVTNIDEIVVSNNQVMDKKQMDMERKSQTVSGITKSFKDKEQMKEIYAALIPEDYYWNNTGFIEAYESVNVIVTFIQDEYGNKGQESFLFKKDQIPEFVKTALSIKEE